MNAGPFFIKPKTAHPARTSRRAFALEMPDDVRLDPWNRDRQYVTVGGPELDHVGPSSFGP
jgi:hypothetical protein